MLASKFSKIIIIPLRYPDDAEKTDRVLPDNVFVDRTYIDEYGRKRAILASIITGLFSRYPYVEVYEKPVSIGRATSIRMMDHLSEALRVRRWLLDKMRDKSIDIADSIFYTYWLSAPTLGIGLVKKEYPELTLVSRAHGADVYEKRYNPPYIPFQKRTLELIDRVFVISDDGKRYLSDIYPYYANKISLARLGVPEPGFITQRSDDGTYRVVSCSYMVPVKRIHLLIEGLTIAGKQNPLLKFEWTHIGSGPLKDELEKKASLSLPPNVRFRLLGQLQKEEVIDYYKDNIVDIFINVSESEGIPVSIMEAQSCGIPTIATSVGGTPEIVCDNVGALLSAYPAPQDISETIVHLLTESDSIEKKKQKARDNWKHRFNAEINFEQFANQLLGLH